MVSAGDDLLTDEMRAAFKTEDEHVMYCEKTKKHKNYGDADNLERIYVMTTHNIYTYKMRKNTNQYKLTRYYQIKDVGAIILSSENESDFMLFFTLSEDLHLSSSSRRELLDLLTLRFFTFKRNTTLKIYSVPTEELVTYHKTNNAQSKI